MFKAVGTFLVVKIDRALQLSRTTLSGSGLIAAPQYEHMQYLLQLGEIMSVGEKVTNPHIKVGNRAIMHHLVEAEDKYLLQKLPNGDELRWLDSQSQTYNYKLYGVVDKKNNIIPLETFVFCYPEPDLEQGQVYEQMEFGTETLQFKTKAHQFGEKKENMLYLAHLPEKVEEKKYVKPVIAHVAPTEQYLKSGMQIVAEDFTRYPLRVLDIDYWILSREFILSIVKTP